MVKNKEFKLLHEIKQALSELSLGVFGTDRVLNYETFRFQTFSDIHLTDYEYEVTTGRRDLLLTLEKGLQGIIRALEIPENMNPRPPEKEIMERNSAAAKITYKRALYLVRLDRFCDAALTTAFAADYLIQSSPSLKEDPYLVIKSAYTMAIGLLEETFTSYMDPDKYTASDCRSSCGYCQDPLSTVAKYCTDALDDMAASRSTIKDVWTKAAAMLGAYALQRGATLEPMSFSDGFPQQVKVALKMILLHEKTDQKSFFPLVDHYLEKLRICHMNYLTDQYEDAVLPWDWDEGFL